MIELVRATVPIGRSLAARPDCCAVFPVSANQCTIVATLEQRGGVLVLAEPTGGSSFQSSSPRGGLGDKYACCSIARSEPSGGSGTGRSGMAGAWREQRWHAQTRRNRARRNHKKLVIVRLFDSCQLHR